MNEMSIVNKDKIKILCKPYCLFKLIDFQQCIFCHPPEEIKLFRLHLFSKDFACRMKILQ